MVGGGRWARQEGPPGWEVQAGHSLPSRRSGEPGRVMGAVAEVSLTFTSKDVLSSMLHDVCEIWRSQVFAEIHFRVLGDSWCPRLAGGAVGEVRLPQGTLASSSCDASLASGCGLWTHTTRTTAERSEEPLSLGAT